MMRMVPESRIMKWLNGKLLELLASDGTIFKGASQNEIARRDRKSKRKMKGGGSK